jgi:HEAT repeat protein
MSEPSAARFDELLTQLQSRNAQQRRRATHALATMGDRRAVQALIAALNDRSKYVRGGAAWALGQLGDPAAFDALLLAIQKGRVGTGGVEALARVDPERALDPLLQRLQAPDRDTRWHAARELCQLRDPRAVKALTTALQQDPDDLVRSTAARALGMLHAQGVVVPFYQSSDDSSEANRIELAIARLTELGVQVHADTEGYLLYVPHNTSGGRMMEIGYLMAQLVREPFPLGYAPLSGVISFVLPERPYPVAEYRESYPDYDKYFVDRRRDKRGISS